MMKKLLLASAVLFAVVVIPITVANRYTQVQAADMTSPDITAKLDQILNNQKSIMQTLDFLKQELNIIKIRITQRQ